MGKTRFRVTSKKVLFKDFDLNKREAAGIVLVAFFVISLHNM